MTILQYLLAFGLALTAFLIIDLLWLGVIAKDLYRKYMGSYLRKKPNWPVAMLFYALFIVGLMYFAIVPAINEQSYTQLLMNASAYGFFTYITYDLTALAVIPNWSKRLTVIDIVWGTFLALSVGSITYIVYSILIF